MQEVAIGRVIEVAYSNTTADLVAYLDHQARGHAEIRRHRLGAQAIFLGVAASAVAVAALAAVRGRVGTLPLRAVGLAAAVALAVLLMGPLARWARRSSWRRMLGGDRGEALRAPRLLRVEDAGLLAITAAGETLTPWSEVRGVTVLPDHVIVQVGPVAAHVVPRRAFAAGEMERFTGAIRARLIPRG